ncbi:hypothetical protein E143388_05490 [Rhodococcus opacus]|nr:hypothetical protein E143388_05490 [Rhodococcus opacus]
MLGCRRVAVDVHLFGGDVFVVLVAGQRAI